MTSESTKSTCTEYRAFFEPGSSTEMPAALRTHGEACSSCRIWERQVSDVTAMAKTMPQFDVPEALTQRILSAVDEDSRRAAPLSGPAAITVAACALATLALVVPFESLESLGAWALGLGGIVALKLLVTNAQALEANT